MSARGGSGRGRDVRARAPGRHGRREANRHRRRRTHEGSLERLEEEQSAMRGLVTGAAGRTLVGVQRGEERLEPRARLGRPMPPNVVKTMGRKARPMSSQPVLCLWFFDLALDMKIASASCEAARM